ncbi:hypothetical protein Hanom_Chr01g00029741 [Helianthus anomalus]
MKDKGKGTEGVVEISERSIVPSGVVENPRPLSAIYAVFEEYVLLDDDDEEEEEEDDDDEDEDEEEEDDDDEDDVFSASSHSDVNDDDDDQGGTGVKCQRMLMERGRMWMIRMWIKLRNLILRIEPEVEEGEIRHTYTLDEVLKMFNVNEDEFKFDFEEELNAFDINQQPEYQYKYVDEADNYDRVEVEDCSDEENMNEDTSEFPTLVEFFN